MLKNYLKKDKDDIEAGWGYYIPRLTSLLPPPGLTCLRPKWGEHCQGELQPTHSDRAPGGSSLSLSLSVLFLAVSKYLAWRLEPRQAAATPQKLRAGPLFVLSTMDAVLGGQVGPPLPVESHGLLLAV